MIDRPILFFCGDLHNLGDLALLLQNLELVAPGKRAYVRQWRPLPTDIVTQVAAAGGALVEGRALVSFLSRAARCDIIIGGGQLVRDNVSLASLVSQLAAALIAKACGGTVSTRGLGVGAIAGRLRRALWRQLLRTAPVVLVRDAASERNAVTLVGKGRVRLTADMAFVPSSLHRRAAGDAQRHDLVLIAPCIDDSEGRTIDGAAFPMLIEEVSRALPGTTVAFVCHDPRADMDAHAVTLLTDRHGVLGYDAMHGYNLAKLLEEYHRAALVVTNRLHAAIFALLAGRPVLIVDDGNTKTIAAAARFHIPVVKLAKADTFRMKVADALRYDASARAAALQTTAQAAKTNLPPESVAIVGHEL